MKNYFGNYLGIVVNNKDPEYRGRVQVFIPHIMPALYEGWNKEGKDLTLECVGDNLPNALTSDIRERLIKVLPWAEAASPIIGGSSPGSLFENVVQGAVQGAIQGASTGGFAGAIGGAVAGGTAAFVQTPTSNPSQRTGNALADSALNLIGQSTANLQGTDGGNLGCAAAVSLMFKQATGQDIIPGQTIVTGTTQLYSHMSKSSDYIEVPIEQMQPGDILVTARGSRAGHTGIYVGEGRIVSNSSSGFMGSERGTIQNNYSIDSWKSGVITRNPTGSGVFRYVGASSSSTTPIINEQTSNSAAASPNPLANKEATVAETAPTPAISAGGQGITGTVSGGGTSSRLKADSQGRVDPFELQNYVTNRLASTNSSLLNKKFPEYGIREGTAEEWGKFFTKLAEKESTFNVKPRSEAGESDPGGSYGLFQVSPLNGTRYKANPAGRDWTIDELRDPENNTNTAIRIFEQNLESNPNLIQTRGGVTAGVGYFSLTSMSKIRKDIGDGKAEVYATPATGSGFNPTSVVNNTDGNGRTPTINTNDMANGMFAYPNPGAMVWVFFREGNPLFPVYFAASYSSSEWKSAYRHGSEGELMSWESGANVSSSVIKPSPAGGILAKNRTSPDPLDNESVFSMFHQHGSNISLKDGCDFFYSRNNKRDEVENDRFVITKGYKEQWVEGDESTNVRGNVIIKVGKIDAESIKAAQELSDFSYELNQILTKK